MDINNDGLPYNQLREYYSKNFSLGYLNTDINNKFALISLICYITYSMKMKKPDVTTYQVIMKLSEGLGLPESFIKGLAVICEDFLYGCKDFPMFGLKQSEIVSTIKGILKNYIPF